MNILKFSVILLIAIFFCILGGFGIGNIYYQSLISDYGYKFGSGDTLFIMSACTLIGLLTFVHACSFLENPKKAILWLVGIVIVVSPIIYFTTSSLSKDDKVYQQALINYGSRFNVLLSKTENDLKKHPDYIAYKYQLDNFEKDKESRAAYVTLLNEKVDKYNKYISEQAPGLSFSASRYYIYGPEFNKFVMRYKGVEDPVVQKNLYGITKSGVVSYNDMMDFQVKFVDNYKNVINKDSPVVEHPSVPVIVTPAVTEENKETPAIE
jgi:hypothetical protein